MQNNGMPSLSIFATDKRYTKLKNSYEQVQFIPTDASGKYP